MQQDPRRSEREVAKLKSRIEQQVDRLKPVVEQRAQAALTKIEIDDRLHRRSERLTIAQNLWQIIAEAEGQGTLKRRIADEAGLSDSNGKSGRLYEYAVDPALDDVTKQKRAARLVKRASNYLRIAQTAAKLAGLNLSDTVIRLVSGTRFEPEIGDLENDSVPEHFDMLARIIQSQAKRIAENALLGWYFETIDEQGLTPNGDDWQADEQAWLWTHAAVPSAVLFTEEVACFVGYWRAADEKKVCPKLVRVCRQVSLGLAPFGDRKTVRPYFIRRPVLLVSNPPSKEPRTAENLLSVDLSYPMVIGGLPDPEGYVHTRKGTLKVDGPEAVRGTALCPAYDYPGDDHEFIEVTPALIHQVFETGLSVERWIKADALARPAPAFTKSPPGTLTAALERALLYGSDRDDPKTMLMARLEEKARGYVDGLRGFVDRTLEEIESRADQLIDG